MSRVDDLYEAALGKGGPPTNSAAFVPTGFVPKGNVPENPNRTYTNGQACYKSPNMFCPTEAFCHRDGCCGKPVPQTPVKQETPHDPGRSIGSSNPHLGGLAGQSQFGNGEAFARGPRPLPRSDVARSRPNPERMYRILDLQSHRPAGEGKGGPLVLAVTYEIAEAHIDEALPRILGERGARAGYKEGS